METLFCTDEGIWLFLLFFIPPTRPFMVLPAWSHCTLYIICQIPILGHTGLGVRTISFVSGRTLLVLTLTLLYTRACVLSSCSLFLFTADVSGVWKPRLYLGLNHLHQLNGMGWEGTATGKCSVRKGVHPCSCESSALQLSTQHCWPRWHPVGFLQHDGLTLQREADITSGEWQWAAWVLLFCFVLFFFFFFFWPWIAEKHQHAP